ncbi:MAG: hypothetical protein ABI638_15010 [Ignavibacteriota bacterium]
MSYAFLNQLLKVKRKTISSKIIDVVCFVGGSSLFIGTLFSLHSFGSTDSYRNYYYSTVQTFLLAIGIGLIVLGILIRNWRNRK